MIESRGVVRAGLREHLACNSDAKPAFLCRRPLSWHSSRVDIAFISSFYLTENIRFAYLSSSIRHLAIGSSSSCRTGDRGALQIAGLLSKTVNLEHLVLHRCNIKDIGGAAIATALRLPTAAQVHSCATDMQCSRIFAFRFVAGGLSLRLVCARRKLCRL